MVERTTAFWFLLELTNTLSLSLSLSLSSAFEEAMWRKKSIYRETRNRMFVSRMLFLIVHLISTVHSSRDGPIKTLVSGPFSKYLCSQNKGILLYFPNLNVFPKIYKAYIFLTHFFLIISKRIDIKKAISKFNKMTHFHRKIRIVNSKDKKCIFQF